MRDAIKEIHAEHRTMARLLTALEQQIAIFEEAGETDYELVCDILEYFLGFPEKCHHPKEDVLSRLLLDKVPERAAALKDLPRQHEELAELTQRTAALVKRVLEEAEIPRETVINAAREYAEAQRKHMAMEEKYFLPLAEEVLSEADRSQLTDELFREEEPLFGSESTEHYAELRDRVLAAETAG